MTAQQHFVSRAEQSLNAANPAADDENLRIFSFSVTDREAFKVSLDSDRGRAIASTLVLRDLFSFDVIERDGNRFNLEALFGKYESRIQRHTLELLRKLQAGETDIKAEILDLFVAKFVNFLRNPYSVKKVLNSITPIFNYVPTDPEVLRQFRAVLDGKKPQQEFLCAQLGITPLEYRNWLAALFLLLVELGPDEPLLLEGIVKGLYEDPSNEVGVYVHQYSGEHLDKRCLLSDRGYSMPASESEHLSFSFNLSADAFISYVFINVATSAREGIRPDIMELFLKRKKNVSVRHLTNDLPMLALYNQRCVYQCHQTVYCSSRTLYGVDCIPD